MVDKKTTLVNVRDHFTDEVAVLKHTGECKTFGVNCGATFRMPVRLIARVQRYLVEQFDVPLNEVATTSDALQTLLKSLDIVSDDEASLYFDTRKERDIEADLAKSEATSEARESATADTSDEIGRAVFEALQAGLTAEQIAQKMRANHFSDGVIAQYLPELSKKPEKLSFI